MTAGSVVVTYNLPDGKIASSYHVKSTPISFGQNQDLNDTRIAQANPGGLHPTTDYDHCIALMVVARQRLSHLECHQSEWKCKVGAGKPDWPAGAGAKGNEGVTAQVQQSQGAIGYTEYGYAGQNNLAMAALGNKAGKFVEPTPEAVKTLASELPADLQASITDPRALIPYPIVTYTWLMAC